MSAVADDGDGVVVVPRVLWELGLWMGEPPVAPAGVLGGAGCGPAPEDPDDPEELGLGLGGGEPGEDPQAVTAAGLIAALEAMEAGGMVRLAPAMPPRARRSRGRRTAGCPLGVV